MDRYPQKYNELVEELLKREKGKKQVNVAQMREVVSNLCDIFSEGNHRQRHTLLSTLQANGLKRLQAKQNS